MEEVGRVEWIFLFDSFGLKAANETFVTVSMGAGRRHEGPSKTRKKIENSSSSSPIDTLNSASS